MTGPAAEKLGKLALRVAFAVVVAIGLATAVVVACAELEHTTHALLGVLR